ncbi:RNA recognition motif. (a.k.a. RRM, RBD, or RNP domain) [Mucilaginibacter pineti]|uniref:RNA recognition motif. (A.k.a. RRM, RBD, or RNP domain) n=1 Tax=Mucilaginibacter pineti TaxID=1391627 RepID=A0A1G7L266_9SPHI|nr:RNA-binding protein [Mucilaginibacter pineti]SDF43424.1 RNA recognition motif. (a.k.a. RRM, RBD, or RNP domain) [Mucilaginibacter pineti]
MVKLFVGGFPLDIEEIELAQLFGPHGDISTIKIVRDKKTKICKGYAFIEMADRSGAENAAEALNGTMLDGKTLTVNINEEPDIIAQPLSVTRNYVRTFDSQKVDIPIAEVRKKRPRRVV